MILFVLVLVAWPFLRERPYVAAMPDRDVAVLLDPVAQSAPPGWRTHGAWELSSADSRLAGLSGLACDADDGLEMVSDIGARIFLPFVEGDARSVAARFESLPGLMDGEAVLTLGGTRAYADELRHRLHVITKGKRFRRLKLPRHAGPANWAVEAAIEPGGMQRALLVFHEFEDRAYALAAFDEEQVEILTVEGAEMAITGGARHPDGRGFVLLRSLGLGGFRAALAGVSVEGSVARLGPALPLDLPFNANAEGICIEPRGAGSTRLWVVTDDNGLSGLAQRLIAWDVPDDAWPQAPAGAHDDRN